jgi:hypothetical protein
MNRLNPSFTNWEARCSYARLRVQSNLPITATCVVFSFRLTRTPRWRITVFPWHQKMAAKSSAFYLQAII